MNAPAHVDVKCHWVGLEKMADFERIYNLWRAEKEKEDPDFVRLDDLSYCLLVLLRFFGNPGDDLADEELPNLKTAFDLAVQPGNYKVNE